MANLTPEQFQQKINDKIRSLKVVDVVTFPVATEMIRLFTNRIFDEGKNGANAQIGTYSTKPMYASKTTFRNAGGFKGVGKKPKKGKINKSMYLPGGYKELKSIQGLENSFVNLTYRGELRRGLKLVTEGDAVEIKVAGLNEKKVSGLTDKYGSETFKHTKEEKEFFKKEVQKKLIAYFSA